MEKPRGNNQLGAKYSYVQRKYYDTIVGDKEADTLALLDLYKYPLYGKINLDNEIIVPIQDAMTYHDGNVGTFEFVSTALADLSSTLQKRINNGTLKKSGPYANLQLTPRENSWRGDYVKYLNDAQKAYQEVFMEGKKDTITSFKEFVNSFMVFSAQLIPSFPLSFSQYYISNKSSLFATGLAVDLNDERYGDDYVSYSQYFEDINFPVFSKEAQDHGFMLDKHAPFRLVVNLNSKPMKDYMKKSGHENMVDVFDRLYFKPLVPEFYDFVSFVAALYDAVLPEDNKYSEVCFKNGHTTFSIKDREVVDFSPSADVLDVIAYTGIDYWLRAFCFIKVREANKNFTQKEFDDFVREVTGVNKYVDTEAALVYISNRIDPLKISDYAGKPTFRF